MIHPDLSSRFDEAHRREMLREARQERLLAGATTDRTNLAERLLHWIGAELAIAAHRLETYHRPQPLCADCD